MSFTCSNLPPSALNARVVRTGDYADYYCLSGFEMTSGTPRATCVGTNTWQPLNPPSCTLIDNTVDSPVPIWVPIVAAVLLSVIFLACLILAIIYCCCGPGRCCGNNKTKPGDDGYHDDGYYDDRKHFHGDGYDDGYYYRSNHGGPYIVPVDFRKQKAPPREYVQYVMVQPQQRTNKPTANSQKTKTVPTSEVTNVVKLMNGEYVPLEKYLKEHPEARLTMVGDREVVYLHDPRTKTPPKQAWKSNPKKTPVKPVVRSRDSSIANAIILTPVNNGDDDLGKEKQQTNNKKGNQKQNKTVGVVVPVESVESSTDKHSQKDKLPKATPPADTKAEKVKGNQGQGDKTGSDLTKAKDNSSDKDSDSGRQNTYSTSEPVRAEYVGSGSFRDGSFDSGTYMSTPPLKQDFVRKAFTTRDFNRFRQAKDFPAWKPHSHPIRDNNTSTK